MKTAWKYPPLVVSALFATFFILLPFEASATNAPSNLAANGASSTQVNLTWTDNSTNETGLDRWDSRHLIL